MILARADYLTFLGLGTSVTPQQDALLTMLNGTVDRSIKKFVGCNLEFATYTHYLPQKSRIPDRDPLIDYFDVSGGRLVAASISGIAEYAQLQLPEIPVRSVIEIREDIGAYGGQAAQDFPDTTILTPGVSYYVDFDEIDGNDANGNFTGIAKSGLVRRIIAYWSGRERSIKVTYTAGYTPDELNLDVVNGVSGIAGDIKMAALVAIQRSFANAGDDVNGLVQSERLGDYSISYAAQAGRLPLESQRLLQPYFTGYSKFI
jgi:hypothetical protein